MRFDFAPCFGVGRNPMGGWGEMGKKRCESPWFAMSHWIMMVVFLQHTDPVLPHYRAAKWTYARGALATMDRDFLGWQGRYFLHNVRLYDPSFGDDEESHY